MLAASLAQQFWRLSLRNISIIGTGSITYEDVWMTRSGANRGKDPTMLRVVQERQSHKALLLTPRMVSKPPNFRAILVGMSM